MIREAIILAGGLGTRLKEAVPDLPKCMAPVAGKPFLFYVINYLRSQGLEKFVFALGHKHEVIEEYLETQFTTLDYQCSVEEEPLGTGGAIQLAMQLTTGKNVLISNGDTLFKINIGELNTFHTGLGADCTVTLKPMKNIDRYGLVELNIDNSIAHFKEKQFYQTGLINGGTYAINVERFLARHFPAKFSFENDYLEKNNGRLFGLVQDEYFIDIGIPEDYKQAQIELMRPSLDLNDIDKSWTLFIDRDGVINHEKKDGYILNKDEFQFYDGVIETFHLFNKKFGKILIVSNQRGVGKGLMTEADLTILHKFMRDQIETEGGQIDNIYYCPSINNKHPERKPNPGMAFRAKADLPFIDLSKSIIVGNKASDMLFGRNAGMYSVFLATTNPQVPFPHSDIDLRFSSLPDFAKAL